MRDLKKAVGLTCYGLGVKAQAILSIVFFVLGVITVVVTKGEMIFGSIYILIGSNFILNSYMTVGLSGLVRSSGKARPLLLTYGARAFGYPVLSAYTFLVVLHYGILRWELAHGAGAEAVQRQGADLLGAGIVCVGIALYYGIAYKKYLISTFIFCFTMPFAMIAPQYKPVSIWLNEELLRASYLRSVVIGYILVGISIGLYFLVSRAVYRLDLDKFAYQKLLDRESK